ncbi:carboxymuconolactone decarboxylase family protein [Herbiconiux sp. UC225_62]|uniref:carboxymuconolactone decarboxylase family protein n=1 Tax=Herbiconiux sp. UC225_62 TaxID=3350168 RepID=UPI0036D313EC
MANDLWLRGDEARRRVMGEAYVAETRSRASSEEDVEFDDFVTQLGWGATWARAELDVRTRSAITVMALVANGNELELEGHIAGALRNGLTRREIAEIVRHAAIYCGIPAAKAGMRALGRTRRLQEEDGLDFTGSHLIQRDE